MDSYLRKKYTILIKVTILFFYLTIPFSFINYFLGLGLGRLFDIPVLYLPILLIIIGQFIIGNFKKKIPQEILILSVLLLLNIANSSIREYEVSSIFFKNLYLLICILSFYFGYNNTFFASSFLIKLVKFINVSIVFSIFFYYTTNWLHYVNIFDMIGINRNNYVFYNFLSLGTYIYLFRQKQSYGNLVGILIPILHVIVVGSRSGYIAFVFMIVLFYLEGKSSRTKFSLFFFFSFIGTLSYILIEPVRTVLFQVVSLFDFENIDLGIKDGRRRMLLFIHLQSFYNNPYLGVGFGFGNIVAVNLFERVGSPHNIFVKLLSEFGAIGTFLIFSVYYKIFRKVNSLENSYKLTLRKVVFPSLILLSFGNEYFITNPLMWFFTGFLISK